MNDHQRNPKQKRPSKPHFDVPVSSILHVDFAVLSEDPKASDRTENEIRSLLLSWASGHLEGEDLKLFQSYVQDEDLVSFEYLTAEEYELPDEEILLENIPAAEIEKLQQSAGAWLVSSIDTLESPRKGLAVSRTAAHALAMISGGWVLDPASCQVAAFTKGSSTEEQITFDSEPDLQSEVIVLADQDQDGLISLVITGLEKFGLPDLALEELVERDTENVTLFGRAVFHFLSEKALDVEPSEDQPQSMRLQFPISLSAATLRDALYPTVDWGPSDPLGKWAIDFELAHDQDDDALGTLIVLPPRKFAGEVQEWWTDVSKRMHAFRVRAEQLSNTVQ
jgi:hypothetical protein